MTFISRAQYAALYGPTVGDRIRLADTQLLLGLERDLLHAGDEVVFGGGKTTRDGQGQRASATSAGGALDLVITNVIVDEATAVLCELHAVAAGWLAAAVRLGALDYVQAQTLLHAAAPWLVAAAAIGQDVHWTDMGGWAPLIDIRQMQHAASESRLFAS